MDDCENKISRKSRFWQALVSGGLALEVLATQIHEYDLAVSKSEYEEIAAIGARFGVEEGTGGYSPLRSDLSPVLRPPALQGRSWRTGRCSAYYVMDKEGARVAVELGGVTHVGTPVAMEVRPSVGLAATGEYDAVMFVGY